MGEGAFSDKFPSPKDGSKPAKIFILNSFVNGHISINTRQILTNEGSKFKLDCTKFRNGNMLLIYNISFKLRLINLVYFFETPGIFQS